MSWYDGTTRTLELTSQTAVWHSSGKPLTTRTSAWYDKPSPTFVDAISLVRHHPWLASEDFSPSAGNSNTHEFPVALYHRMVDSLAYAA